MSAPTVTPDVADATATSPPAPAVGQESAAAPEPVPLSPGGAPARQCDIVMKGGVTSGIVYPPAVYEIAKAFRFVNIGGTSAGAIAASLTAAAEYRRLNGGGLAGFELLARVPEELAKNGRLVGLFRADDATKPAFDALEKIAGAKDKLNAGLSFVIGLVVRKGWLLGILGAVPGVAFAIRSGRAETPPDAWGIVAGVLLAIAGWLITCAAWGGLRAWKLVRATLGTVIANGFGMSRGVAAADIAAANAAAAKAAEAAAQGQAGAAAPVAGDTGVLSTWLAAMLNEIAGLDQAEPLTFGHLWYGRTPASTDSEDRPDDTKINLEMVTTCLSHGRPYTFPTGQDLFYFDPAALRAYLPGHVVAWMERKSRVSDRDGGLTAEKLGALKRMPWERDLPVVLVARMSLAFPLLLAAVPLAAVDADKRPRKKTQAGKTAEPALPEPCWFVDGGLSSNFPIHLFDAPLPRWPTFGINLGSFSQTHPYDENDESQNAWMVSGNSAGTQQEMTAVTGWGGYAGAMLGAAKDWNDNVQMRVPGFRDRIVTIGLRAEEGGLNLDMDEKKIMPLVARGRRAGQLLVERFAVPSDGTLAKGMTWENHRIVRFRTAMSAVQRFLRSYKHGYEEHQPGDATFATLLQNASGPSHELPAYPWGNAATRDAAQAEAERLVAMSDAWANAPKGGIDFTKDAPHPSPDLVKRVRA
jgi:predicted acylesterase/phospholipase RssA